MSASPFTRTFAFPTSSAQKWRDLSVRLFGGLWFLALSLAVAVNVGVSHEAGWPSRVSSFCLAIFYLVLALLMVSRPPYKAQAEGFLPKFLGFAGAYFPWVVSYFFGKTHAALPNIASTAFILVGTIMMLVTIRHLGGAFSLVPQARNVVQSGPYKWIKHPLYASEAVTMFGAVLQNFTLSAAGLFVVHMGIQVARILYEEDILRRTCPEYSEYEAKRWRLVPYIW